MRTFSVSETQAGAGLEPTVYSALWACVLALEFDSFADCVRYAVSYSNATQVLSLTADFVRFVCRQ